MKQALMSGLLFTLAALMPACGGDEDTPPPQQPGTAPPSAQVSGTYLGESRVTITQPGDAVGETSILVIRLRLTQSGNRVTGDFFWITPDETVTDTGTLTGTVSGSQITLNVTLQDADVCPGYQVGGTLTLLGDRLTGTLAGPCAGESISYALTLDRQ